MTIKTDSLESARLVLEVRKEHHASELYDYFCDKDLYAFTRRDVPVSPEWLGQGFKDLEKIISPDGKELWLGWVGRDKTSQKPIGIFEMSLVGEDCYIAYTIFKENWGAGFAVEGTEATVAYMNRTYSPKRFLIEMDTRNRTSVKVAEKLGFEFVKLINNAAFLKNFVSHEFQFQKVN
jgi:RimJ/RimL family protein N-acetyltransferase